MSNIEITKYFNYEIRFNGAFSRNNPLRIRDDKKSEGIHWVSLFVDRNTAVYFDPFLIEYTPEKYLKNHR